MRFMSALAERHGNKEQGPFRSLILLFQFHFIKEKS